MNMLLGFIQRALEGAVTKSATNLQPQVRTELVQVFDKDGFHYEQRVVANHRRLKSRGKGGKTAHSFSGVRAVKRAAAKRRNRKG